MNKNTFKNIQTFQSQNLFKFFKKNNFKNFFFYKKKIYTSTKTNIFNFYQKNKIYFFDKNQKFIFRKKIWNISKNEKIKQKNFFYFQNKHEFYMHKGYIGWHVYLFSYIERKKYEEKVAKIVKNYIYGKLKQKEYQIRSYKKMHNKIKKDNEKKNN